MGSLDRECPFGDAACRPMGPTTTMEADSHSCSTSLKGFQLDINHLRGGGATVAEVAGDGVRASMGKEGNLLRESSVKRGQGESELG